ncbi:MAG: hypothetical protein BYD32DRAFT_414202 [Podila humilis]|nr:MAG: hypothetical protein BYD32DRAFT_414202 [Podila humilis]
MAATDIKRSLSFFSPTQQPPSLHSHNTRYAMRPILSILSVLALSLTLTATSAAPIIIADPITTTNSPNDPTTGHLPFLNIGSLGFGRRALEPEAFVVRPDSIIR